MLRALTLLAAVTLFMAGPSDHFAGQAGADPNRPLLAVGQTQMPPVMDGAADPDQWEDASSPAALTDIRTGVSADAQPQVWVTWDADALSIAARLPLPADTRPTAQITTRDGPLWRDDSLEVYLQPEVGSSGYYQFIVNSLGVQYDARSADASWNTAWEAQAEVESGHWSVELRLPFAALGLQPPQEGDEWGFNVAWNRQTPEHLIASWAPVKQTLHDAGRFGRLRFQQEAPAVQVSGPWIPGRGQVAFEGAWRTEAPAQARLTLTRADADDPAASATAAYAGGNVTAPFQVEAQLPLDDGFPEPGLYHARLEVTEADRTVYLAQAPVQVLHPLAVSVRPYYLAGYLEVDVDTKGLGIPPAEFTATVEVLSREGTPSGLGHRDLRVRDDLTATARFDVSDLPPGSYQAAVLANDRQGRLIRPETLSFTRPETPEWFGSTAGISDDVLAPWTPVELDGEVVSVWGRQYAFGPLPLPSVVETAGASLLAGPITLRMVADGVEHSWRQEGPLETVEERPSVVRLGLNADSNGIQCRGVVAVEYDGMVRADLSLSSRADREVEHLSLNIPLKAEHAKYLYHYPGRWGSVFNSRTLPEGGFTAGFLPFIWLGDEERGFSWFSESDRNFFLEDGANVTEITRDGEMVTLRINLIQGAHTLRQPLEYTFGFHATPVKPMQPSAWDYRINHGAGYGVQERPWRDHYDVTYPAAGHINLEQGTFEAWVRPCFDTDPDVSLEAGNLVRFNRTLFDVILANGDQVGFYWCIADRGMRVYYRQRGGHPLVLGAPRGRLNQDEWHHVAFTWGDHTRVYVDGQLVAERPYTGTLSGDLARAVIILGHYVGEPFEFDVDQIRISSVPREEFDLTAPPAADEHTLLLDRFDASLPLTGERFTTPEVGEPGRVTGGEVVAGKFSGALTSLSAAGETTVLDRLADLGVRTLVLHQHWTDIQNYTSTTHGEHLHKLVQACHERDIELLIYFGYLLSDLAPEWEHYADETLVYPRTGLHERQPRQQSYTVCYQSGWQDFLAHGIARVMDEYGIDGVYLDGTANPHGCSNVHHGCGYLRPDGTVGQTYAIFATRDMMRRIYTIVRERNPEGQVNVHQSTCMTIPTLSWATSYWDGEQVAYIPPGRDPQTVLPLDAFRTEFMGHQWGVPAEFLCYDRPYTYSEAMSFTLLHDVLVRGRLGGSLEMQSRLWHGMEEFGREGSLWLPYWDNSAYIELGPDDSIKASIYSRAEDGCVVVVSNLSMEEKVAQVRLNREGLVLGVGMEAWDMVNDTRVRMTEDFEMEFPLKPYDFRVIWVRHGGNAP